MAKISTYPGPSSPSLSDMLIGTDVNDMLMTKNFTISDIISVTGSSTYVPYTGAISNVVLGSNTISASGYIVPGGTSSDFLKADGSVDSTAYVPYNGATMSVNLGAGNNIKSGAFIKLGGLSTEFLKADGSVDSNTYLTTTTAGTTYVPYTGATTNVDLGVYKLTSQSLEVTTDDVIMQGIQCYSGNFFGIGSNGWLASGFLVDFVNNRYYLGDWGTAVNGTYIKIDDANSRIELSKGIYTNASEGAVGQVLTSQGPGVPATWSTPFVVPTLGSFYDTTTQTTAGTTNELMQFNNTDISTGISITNDGLGDPTKITFSATGVYNIQFSAQLKKTGGAGATIFYIYLIENGTPVPNSSTAVTLENNGDLLVAAWNWFITISSLPAYCQIGWYTTNANGELHYDAAPVVGIPAIPSVILTVNRVS